MDAKFQSQRLSATSFQLPSGAHPCRRQAVRGLAVYVLVEHLAPNRWPEHRHAEWQITFAFGPGVCEISSPKARGRAVCHRLIGGQIGILPPGYVHAVHWRVTADVIVLYVDDAHVRTHFQKMRRKAAVVSLAKYVAAQPMTAEVCAELRKFGALSNGETDWQVASAGSHLAAIFLETHTVLTQSAIARRVDLAPAIIERIKAHVVERRRGRVPVTQIARDVGTSPRNLRRIFSHSMGEPPQEWVTAQKARRAKHLLESGHSIKETVDKGAFCDARHLNRVLREIFGVTASALQPHTVRPIDP